MISGTVLGFRYRVHIAWLLIVALLLVSLATGIEPGSSERPTGLVVLAIGGVVVALFGFSMLAHELAHAVVSRRLGQPDPEIALLTLGGPTEAEPEPQSPRSELIIAASGPALSGLLGALSLALAGALSPGGSEPAASLFWVCWWLGLANLLLAALYLVPVLPLDGGRIVRALAWGARGDLDRAGDITAQIGRWFGFAVIGGGLVVALSVDLFYGVWTILLGWFTSRMARAAVDRRRLRQLTDGLAVGDATDVQPAVVPSTLTVGSLLAQDDELGQGAYPVMEGPELLGVVYPARLRGLLRRPSRDARIRDVVIPLERTTWFRPDDPLLRAVEHLESMRVDGLPVVDPADRQRLHGIVTRERVLEKLRVRMALAQARGGSASSDARR